MKSYYLYKINLNVMQISLSGATGFIGSRLYKKFITRGWTVNVINRDSFRMSVKEFAEKKIENSDVVINLTGATISKRWTPEWKKEIVQSRIETTRKISDGIQRAARKPSLFISPSAVGIYDSIHRHDDESKHYAEGFLADLCREWESQALRVKDLARLVIFRTGVVIGRDGGAMKKLYPIFRFGLGGQIGNGKAMMPWIHITDLLEAYIFAIEQRDIEGIYNLVAPVGTDNHHFTKTFGKVLTQPTIVPVPVFLLKILYGEGASVLTTGQDVVPDKLAKSGFSFKFPTIEKALVDFCK
jgi:uncharacterized protein